MLFDDQSLAGIALVDAIFAIAFHGSPITQCIGAPHDVVCVAFA